MHQLGLLLLPEFSNLGLAAVIEPLFVANWLAQRPLFQWCTVSADGKPVRASNGALVPVDGDLATARECGSVFVLASFDPLPAARNMATVRWLKRIARSGVELGGIENGSLALAEAGLLDEHPAAVHWDNLAGFQELFPKVRIAPKPFSFTRNRMTCAGAAAILDMMVVWIAGRADPRVAGEVAKHLLLSGRKGLAHGSSDRAASEGIPSRDGLAHGSSDRAASEGIPSGDGQASENTRPDATISRARALMQAHIADPLPCEALAQRLNISLRQLERRFRRAVGRTVHADYKLVRVERAHQYLQQTGLSVTEVAALTGFSSVEYFSKVYRRAFATLPSEDRRQSTDAPVFSGVSGPAAVLAPTPAPQKPWRRRP